MDSAQPSGGSSSTNAAPSLSTVDNKISADLNTVVEKMDLLDSMIGTASSVQKTDALLTVIGFLEACASRMIELVEAAAAGALSGTVLEQCLSVNDRLLKQLQQIDRITLTEGEAVASAPPPEDDMAAFTLDDFDDDDNANDATAKPAAVKASGTPLAGAKSTGEDDDLDDFLADSKMPADDIKPAATAAAATTEEGSHNTDVDNKDSFDDFFAERTATQKKEGDE